MENDLGVGGGVKDGAVVFEVDPKLTVIDHVAVVSDTNRAEAVSGDEGLNILEHGLAGGGVTDVADGEGAREVVKF